MVLDHELEKQAIERGTYRICKRFHLLRAGHARHELGIMRVVRGKIRHLEIPTPQPVLHHRNLVFLRQRYALSQQTHRIPRCSLLDEHRHLQCLSVMSDHALHELDVRRGELDTRKIGRFLYGDATPGLARRTRLNDRYLA